MDRDIYNEMKERMESFGSDQQVPCSFLPSEYLQKLWQLTRERDTEYSATYYRHLGEWHHSPVIAGLETKILSPEPRLPEDARFITSIHTHPSPVTSDIGSRTAFSYEDINYAIHEIIKKGHYSCCILEDSVKKRKFWVHCFYRDIEIDELPSKREEKNKIVDKFKDLVIEVAREMDALEKKNNKVVIPAEVKQKVYSEWINRITETRYIGLCRKKILVKNYSEEELPETFAPIEALYR